VISDSDWQTSFQLDLNVRNHDEYTEMLAYDLFAVNQDLLKYQSPASARFKYPSINVRDLENNTKIENYHKFFFAITIQVYCDLSIANIVPERGWFDIKMRPWLIQRTKFGFCIVSMDLPELLWKVIAFLINSTKSSEVFISNLLIKYAEYPQISFERGFKNPTYLCKY